MVIDKKKYIVGNLLDVNDYKEFENFVSECESTTKNWSLDLQYSKSWEDFFHSTRQNYQNIVIFNKKKEMIALWTFMFDIEMKAVEYSIVIKKEYRRKNLGVSLMLLGERYVKANWGHIVENIFGRIMFPENQKWISTLTTKLNYHNLEFYHEPGILFLGKNISSFFLPDFFNSNLEKVIEMRLTGKDELNEQEESLKGETK